MSEFIYNLDKDNIASILWDLPNKSMNLLTLQGMKDLSNCIEKAVSDPKVIGLIIGSAKKDFSGGMDLNILSSEINIPHENQTSNNFIKLMEIHKVLRKLELAGKDEKSNKTGKPVAWVCSGISAGIGTEIGLACHYRIASDDPKTKVGFPEILVGLFPFGGGTTRLIRMLGAMAASPLLLEGKMLSAKAAKTLGLVDEVTTIENLTHAAKTWIKSATEADIVKPWDKKNYKVPGGAPYHPTGFLTFAGASAMVLGKTQGVYPAHKALMSTAYEGLLVPFDTALRIEARWAVNLLNKKSTINMIRSLFVNKSSLEKGIARPKNVPNLNVRKLGVLGAGMMGAGISYVSAVAGIEVVLIDQNQESADRGKEKIRSILLEGVRRGKTSQILMDETLNRVNVTNDYKNLKTVDLIIEAVFEDVLVKQKVTKLAQEHANPDCIFASNTSTLPISDLAKASNNLEQFIGIHFFSPVNKMALVEIIKGRNTGDKAVAKSLDFVRQIKKTPIVVNDARYFYANRCIIPYLNEGVKMVGEGISAPLIENSARQLGMPVGPLQLIDETSIDLANQIAKATKAALGKNYVEDISDLVLAKMVKNNRLGRKSNAGFYNYDEKGKRQGFWEGLNVEWKVQTKQPSYSEITNRLAFIQCLEAVRALEQGVLTDVRQGDVGAILGWGCMPWAGGPFSWLDLLGAEKILDVCHSLEEKHGNRFAPPKIIETLANKNKTFYQYFNF
jgi:3-hydroxyacyl-CoA dehydrogenase/enoyl-CoA hydratase/3-hydroxybutyryl-CoA epimerase